MLGGGVFITQNKVMPGSYINFVNATKATSTVSDRGIVAIALPLNKAAGTVIEINKTDFIKHSTELLGKEFESEEVVALREIFCNAQKVYVYDLGTDGSVDDAVKALEPYSFNVVCAYTSDSSAIAEYITAVKLWRDELGKKCQLVVYNQTKPDCEGIINVVSKVADEDAPEYALVAWVAGAEAGCAINASCTNMLYNGEYKVIADKTQTELIACITAGEFAFHNVYGEIRVLEDINSLTTTTVDKSDDFKSNQTIRVIDQIANDIARLFSTKYMGKILNNTSGRVSLWGDIIAHHKKLEELRAIENFDSNLVKVEAGATKKSVIITDAINVVNSMSQLYMTVVVQ